LGASWSSLLALALTSAVGFDCQAASVTLVGPLALQGTGFGNVDAVLTLMPQGNADTASGSVDRPAPEVNDVLTGDAEEDKSRTFSAGELAAAGIGADNFYMVFNINEPGAGTTVELDDFSLIFRDGSGNVLPFSPIMFDGPMELDQVGGGTGGAGWLFKINLMGESFFDNASNRVGLSVSAINMVAGGPEVFFFTPVPEPSSLILAATGLAAGLLWILRRRRG
jgi:hypothetical protein